MSHTLSQSIGSLRQAAMPFLASYGIGAGCQLIPLHGGANNRVYRVRDGHRDLVLKCYFRNPADRRDRFGAESSFYRLAWSRSPSQVPEPIGWDRRRRLGLIAFVPGRKLKAREVDARTVGEALAFLMAINRARPMVAGRAFPAASEACFSIEEHLNTVSRRVARLAQIQPESDLDRQVAGFVAEELEPSWQILQGAILQQCSAANLSVSSKLKASERCLSPSDFGFHNALLAADGRLRFFDFEYAGWDDPAKLICDFFSQPALPVPLNLWEVFAGNLARTLGQGKELLWRAKILLPAYRLKWCCIMLNEFVRGERERRQFAVGGSDRRKRAQLRKARTALRAIAKMGDCQSAPATE